MTLVELHRELVEGAKLGPLTTEEAALDAACCAVMADTFGVATEARALVEAHLASRDAAKGVTDEQIKELRFSPGATRKVKLACSRALNEFGGHSAAAVRAARLEVEMAICAHHGVTPAQTYKYVLFKSSFRYEASPNISHVTRDGISTLCGRSVASAATVEDDERSDLPPDCRTCAKSFNSLAKGSKP